MTLTAQLTDQYDNPVATSGLRVRWSKTGKGGWFTATRTTTNASGIATTTFYTSSTVGRVHTVTATHDEPGDLHGHVSLDHHALTITRQGPALCVGAAVRRHAVKGRGEGFGGGKRARTADLLAASQTLSQLSYTPTGGLPGVPAGLK